MSFRVATEAGAIIEIDGTSATIGRDRSCAISFPDDERLSGQHAMIKRVAGRWMVESLGDHQLTAGSSPPARVHWLKPDDTIRLTETGPQLVFDPAIATVVPVAAPVSETPPVAAAANDHVADGRPSATQDATSRSDDAVETPQFSSKQLVAWSSGGLAAIIVVMVLLLSGIFNRSEQQITVLNEPPGATVLEGAASEEPVPELAVVKSTLPQEEISEEAADATGGIYGIVIKLPEGPMYQLGTAFAVSPHRLVTTASLIEAARGLCSPASGMTAVLISPASKRELAVDFTNAMVHPAFSRATAQLDEIIPQGEALEKQIQQATDQAEFNEIEEKIVQLREKAYQTSEERFFHDIGVIEVAEDLEVQLKPIETADRPSISSKIVLVGIPVEQGDHMLAPDAPPGHEKSDGNVLMLLPKSSSEPVKRLVLTCERDLSGFDWPGSPVLNVNGEVIGVYARRTPPGLDNKQTKVTHDAISIGQLSELQ